MSAHDYDLPDDWEEMTVSERQQFFHTFRERLYGFWFQRASYRRERQSRVEGFRIDEELS
jgi:hypothetical protein